MLICLRHYSVSYLESIFCVAHAHAHAFSNQEVLNFPSVLSFHFTYSLHQVVLYHLPAAVARLVCASGGRTASGQKLDSYVRTMGGEWSEDGLVCSSGVRLVDGTPTATNSVD